MTDYAYDGKFAPKDLLPPTNPLKIVSAMEIHRELAAIQTAVNSKLNIANPAFTGTMTGDDITITGRLIANIVSGGTW